MAGPRTSGIRHRMIPVVVAWVGVVGACSSPPVDSSPVDSSPVDSSPVVSSPVDASSTIAAPVDTTTAPDVVTPSGFGRVSATVIAADGSECSLCVWLAETADQRSRGLMRVTDLGAGDAMVFRYPEPHSGHFWMKNTVLPLSIGFFDPTGRYLDQFDMDPCTTDRCPRYPTPDDFLIAVEVVQGTLGDVGVGPGSVIEVTDLPCDG